VTGLTRPMFYSSSVFC